MYRQINAALLATALSLTSLQVEASLILETYSPGTATPQVLGGFSMTDFDLTHHTGGATSVINSPLYGQFHFEDINGQPLSMNRRLADYTSWWNNGESSDRDIFTTTHNWMRLVLPENTRAFSFNVGASFRGRAWIEAYDANNTLGFERYNFSVNSGTTPGFGVYSAGSNGECGAISSIIIEPTDWGTGNFSINQDSCVTTVSEPTQAPLMGLGLAALLWLRRKVY